MAAGACDRTSRDLRPRSRETHGGTHPEFIRVDHRLVPLLVLAIAAIAGLERRACAAAPPLDEKSKGPAFEITYPAELSRSPISTRVYVMLGPDSASAEPRLGPDWMRPHPFFAVDVEGWKPGEPLRIDGKAAGFPDSLDRIKPGKYAAQAVVRLNPRHAQARRRRGQCVRSGRAHPARSERGRNDRADGRQARAAQARSRRAIGSSWSR